MPNPISHSRQLYLRWPKLNKIVFIATHDSHTKNEVSTLEVENRMEQSIDLLYTQVHWAKALYDHDGNLF